MLNSVMTRRELKLRRIYAAEVRFVSPPVHIHVGRIFLLVILHFKSLNLI